MAFVQEFSELRLTYTIRVEGEFVEPLNSMLIQALPKSLPKTRPTPPKSRQMLPIITGVSD